MLATTPRVRPNHQHIDATADLLRIESSLPTLAPSSPPSSFSPTPPSPPTFPSFKVTAKQVTALGATKLPKWQLKAHQQRQAAAMGLRAERNIRTPLPMLRGMRRKDEMRRERTEGRMRDSGLQVKSEKRKRRESRGQDSGGGAGGGEDVGLERGGGSGGLVRIDRTTAQRLQRGERQMSMAKRLKR